MIPAGCLTFAQAGKSVIDDPLPATESQAEAALPKLLWEEAHTIHGDTIRPQARQVIRVLIEAGQPEKAGRAAVQLADCCRLARNYFDAVGFYRQALEIKSLSSTTTANILNGIAQTYAELSAFDLAERCFRQALEQTHDQLETQSTALIGLADIYQQEGALNKASESIAKAVQLRSLHGAGPDPALLSVQGFVGQARRQIENARAFLEKALALYTTNGDVLNMARTLCALSNLSLGASQTQTALEQARQASELADKVLSRRPPVMRDGMDGFGMKWQALLAQARAERAQGHKESALKSYRSSIDYVQGVWLLIMATEESAIAYRQRTKAAYMEYADLLIENGEFKKAYEVTRELKAQTYLYFSGSHRPTFLADDTPRAAEIRERSRLASALRSQLASGLSGSERSNALGKLEENEFKIEATRLEGEMAHRRDRLAGGLPFANINQLLERAAADHIALVDFSVTESHSLVTLFSDGKIYYETLPSRQEIENAVKPFLDQIGKAPCALNLENELRRLQTKSRELFSMLFGSLAERIEPEQRLIVVPDGLLNYLPFEALMQNGRYLIEDHEISYVGSANLLVQPQYSDVQAEDSSKMDLLAFGDPVFGAEARRPVKKKHRTPSIDVLRRSLTARGFQLPPIPRTRDEVESIAGFFPADRTRLYLGKDSTKGALQHESLRRYRRLHFATHSFVDEKSPKRSAVLLTADSEDDGLLDVKEISELDLDCDLVVLSACQTGRGQLLTGEGIIGLARAFLYAGARSVAVSLWSVSDISTSHLMKNFYQHLADNVRTTEALRQAKLQMLQSGNETRHPYYWAPFISVGKP